MKNRHPALNFIFIALMLSPIFSYAESKQTISACLYEEIAKADDSATIGSLKVYCSEKAHAESLQSAIKERIVYEAMQEDNPFSLQAHRPNYIIISNNFSSPNEKPFKTAFPSDDINFQPWETKFQISLKVPVIRDLFGMADVFGAYTNRSFWQQFNKKGSSPFRDSNHELESWLSFRTANDADDLLKVVRLGFSHQSNGQSGALSRSWNRIYSDFIFEKGNWHFSAKPWLRIKEHSDDDDNPDIHNYLGNLELSGVYKKGKHTFDFMVRNNLRSSDNNHGALQLNWSYPLSSNVRGYVQWFTGYGESLIDYNAYTNSLGIGFQLTDWL